MLPLFSIKGKNYVHHIRNATPSDKIHEAITHFYDVPQHNALENKINFIAAAQTTQVPTQDLKTPQASQAPPQGAVNLEKPKNVLMQQAVKVVKPQNIEEIAKNLTNAGLIGGVVAGLVSLYAIISNTFLYPILAGLFFLMTIILVFWIVKIAIKIRKENDAPIFRSLLCILLYLIIYLDLFLIIYQEKRATVIVFSFERDVFFFIVAAFLGFFIGKTTSRSSFEEKIMP